jgi:regulation of enolase protein 1 (concanavalin A-like superfamily)
MVLLLWACGLLMAMPVISVGQNYALAFGGGNTSTFAEDGDFVDLGYILDIVPRGPKTIEFWCNVTRQTGSNMFLGFNDPASVATRAYLDDNNNGGALRLATNGAAIATLANVIRYSQVQHIAVVDTGTALRVYRDGQLVGNANVTWNPHPPNASRPTAQIGRGFHSDSARYFRGWIDEFRIWGAARTQAEIQATMKTELLGDEPGLVGYWNFNEGEGTIASDSSPNRRHGKVVGATWTTDAAPVEPVVTASRPMPGNGSADLPREVVLSWTGAPGAVAQDVYFGAVRADVNNAGRANPLGGLVSQGQTATTYTPASALEYGTTYYWRIDAVGTPPASAVVKGRIWSFTIEPYAYPIRNVTATASSTQAGMGPERTVDGSGLNAGDQHSTELKDMWLAAGTPPNWIQYEFDKAYKLQELWVWNSNQIIESIVGFGAKDVTIEYSVDGSTWTILTGVPEFTRATGQATYLHNTTVDFGGVSAKYVKLTINSSWSGVPQVSLSEVRFLYVPVQAREPVPAHAATGVSLDATLSWRPGRGAATHTVYMGTDKDAVVNGIGPAQTVSDRSFSPASLDFGTTYYWRVDEVNAVSHPGSVWSFTTQEYLVIDDFESYNDDMEAKTTIFDTWIDGLTDGLSNSVVGHAQAPFAERAILHGGTQSIPFEYNNVKTPFYSQAERTFDTLQDWTAHGADTLSLWVRGYAAAYVEQAGVVTMSAAGTDIWGNADDFRFAFQSLTGNGSIVVRVESLVNTNAWAKAGVMIRQSLDADSTFAYMIVSYSSGVSFGWRQQTASACGSATQAGVAAPQWVKLTRTGDAFTAQYSADGKTWLDVKNADGTVASTTVNMTGPVYIGLCVTSHNTTATTTAVMSGVATTGTVTGPWQVAAIGDDPQTANGAGNLYVTVQDSAGKKATATHPTAVTSAAWTQWQIPLSSLAGVNLSRIKTLSIGVGDPANPKAGGAGKLYLDDLGFGHPAIAP